MSEVRRTTVALVGHCGPDAFMLKSAVERAAPTTTVEMVNDRASLAALDDGSSLLLVNRELDGDFETSNGIELIRLLAERDGGAPMILVSNFEEAQQEAIGAGALPGFGKSELYDAAFGERLGAGLA